MADGTVGQAGEIRVGEANRAAWEAMFAGAVVVPVGRGGWIRARGDDRVRWLNGMVTNSIVGLAQGAAEGEGCLNLVLSAQGKIQGTVWAFAMADELLLETDAAQAAGMVELLDRFIIMDDVELEDVSAAWEGLVVVGPAAALELRSAGLEVPTEERTGLRKVGGLMVVRKAGRLFARWEVWGAAEEIAAVRRKLTAAGAMEGGAEVLDGARLLEGVPQFGVDLRERELPQEMGLVEALHFNKGCYLGQEIVERIRSRGNVHRAFVGVELMGELPEVGAAVMAGDKAVGELTTVGEVPGWPGRPEGVRMALGFLRREAVEGRAELRAGEQAVRPIGVPVPIVPGAHQTK